METVAIDDSQAGRMTEILGRCPLFRALKPEHLPQILKIGQATRYLDGEVVLRQGEPADSFFVLMEGEAAIQVPGPSGEAVEIGRMPQPASFGEVALLLNQPRTASVVAVGDLTALRFSAKAFEAMFQKIPNFGSALSAGLAHRLHELSDLVALPEYDTGKGLPGPEVVGLLPAELCQRHRVVPVEASGNRLVLGTVDGPTSQVLSAVREHLPGLEVQTARIDLGFFNRVMQTYAGVEGWKAGAVPEAPAAAAAPRSPRLDSLLQRMVGEGASDLHLSAGHRPHWRVDGDMKVIGDAPLLGADEVLSLLSPVMEPRHLQQFKEESDTDFSYFVPGVARFRVNLFRDHEGVGAVFRLIPSKVLNLDQLALPPVLKTFCDMPKGLVLVTGPTGSGKSTTLAAMIDYIKSSKSLHIVTLEDPIEFVHRSGQSLINQREVGGHTRSFARALKAALREDPDVVMVGEMRDPETIALALETANTGHLVLATLHTNTAISAVDRIVDQFPGEQQAQVRSVLADVLRGVVAQTLLRKVGGGRLAVLEVLVVNMAIGNLIREDKAVQIPGMMQASKGAGMALLNDELGRLVEARQITMEEAVAAAVDKEDLHRRFRSGLTVTGEPPDFIRFRVVAVAPDSPGAAAGLQRGDLLVEVNAKPAAEFTLDEVRLLLRTDGRHTFTIDRGGKRLKPVVELKRF